jgi:uroporphyrinogen-III synthase
MSHVDTGYQPQWRGRDASACLADAFAIAVPETGGNMTSTLAGKRIVNTRASHVAAELDELLLQRGAEPLAYPSIRVVPPPDTAPLDEAVRDTLNGRFDWLLLPDAHAAYMVGQRLAALGLGPLPESLRVGAIGERAAQATERELGRRPYFVPEEAVAESFLRASSNGHGLRVLLPEGDLALPLLARGPAEHSVHVTAVPAYRTLLGSGGVDLPLLLAEQRVDAVTLTSPVSARNLDVRLDAEGAFKDALVGLPLACIDSATAAAAAELGGIVLESGRRSLDGLIDELERFFERPRH